MALLLQVVDGVVANRISLDKQVHTIGRHPQSDIFIDDISVSARHAVIEARESAYFDGYCDYYLRDTDSTNGTFINDEPVTEQKLSSGDLVRIAWNTFRFVDENQIDLEKTTHILQGSRF